MALCTKKLVGEADTEQMTMIFDDEIIYSFFRSVTPEKHRGTLSTLKNMVLLWWRNVNVCYEGKWKKILNIRKSEIEATKSAEQETITEYVQDLFIMSSTGHRLVLYFVLGEITILTNKKNFRDYDPIKTSVQVQLNQSIK